MYGCDSWSIKKAECWRIDPFELWCWRRLLRVPWTATRSSQSILKEISLEYSLEGLMLKLKLQYLATWCEEATHWKRPRCWERLKARGEGEKRGWDGWMATPTQWTWVWACSRRLWGTGKLGILQSWDCKESYMTELNCYVKEIIMLHLSLLKQHFRIYRVLKCDVQKMNIFIENFCFIC